MTTPAEEPARTPTKAKIARRVIEVLDYFDDDHREATVMDIARRYGRPQSSTSELLSSLVDLGVLLKNPNSRSYRLTPRAALLGTGGQVPVVREGGLSHLLDRLVAHTGLSVALFGMVRLNCQLSIWRPGPRCDSRIIRELHGGKLEPLSDSTAGLLLLATLPRERREGVLHRLSAEATEDRKFSVPQMAAKLVQVGEEGLASGPVGFGSRAKLVACVLPRDLSDQPLVVGVVHGDRDRVDTEGMKSVLQEGVRQLAGAIDVHREVSTLSSAA